VCFGRGVRLRPGGVLPARFVAEGLGLLARGVAEPEEDGEPEDDGEPEGEPGPVDRGEPVDGIGVGEGMSVGDGRADPPLPDVPAGPCPPPGEAPPAAHGMIEAPGPPSSPIAITVKHPSSAATRAAPRRRICRWRRPDTSVNTGLP
jgi:hypothetical protein